MNCYSSNRYCTHRYDYFCWLQESATEQQTEGENSPTEGSGGSKQVADAGATAGAAAAPTTTTTSAEKKPQQAQAQSDTPETIQMLTQLLERLEILDAACAGDQESVRSGVPLAPRSPISARVLYEAIERHQLASIAPSILHVLNSVCFFTFTRFSDF